MSKQLVLYVAELDRGIEIDPRSRLVFGASETCDVDLRRYFPAAGVRTISRRHFEIACVRDEGYAITDLNSLNGTRVNGHRLRPYEPCFLKDGDVVRLAENLNFQLQVIDDNADKTELLCLAPAADPAAAPRIEALGQLYLAEDGRFILDSAPIPHQHLTALEEKLLLYLYERAGRVCPYHELIRDVWGYARYEEMQDNTVAKVASNLRKKLDAISAGAGARHVHTVRGRGLTCAPV